jgi:hypothetical protein
MRVSSSLHCMLLTKLAEQIRWRTRPHRMLAERSGSPAATGRPSLVIVPSCFGVAFDDLNGDPIWGHRRQFLGGSGLLSGNEAGPQQVVNEFPLLPGLWGVDVMGGFIRYLEQIGGYTLDEDLFVFAYDWRAPVTQCAAKLGDYLHSLRGASDASARFDLMGFSSGGMVIRSYLIGSHAIRRVVYLCAPQRGSLSALQNLQEGMEFTRFSRRFHNLGKLPGAWDFLPHPDESVIVDAIGNATSASLYDPDVWQKYKMVGYQDEQLEANLSRSAALHRKLDESAAAPPAWVIGANDVATATRVVIDNGKIVIPHCMCDVDSMAYPFAYGPGDGAVPAATVAAAPGLVNGVWWTKMGSHQSATRNDDVRRLAVEALIAPDKTDASALYELRRPTGVGRKTSAISIGQ